MEEQFGNLLAIGDDAKSRIKDAVESKLTSVLFVACLLCSSVMSIVETGVVNPFAPELWIGVANRFLTSYVTYLLFVTPGERDEIERDKKHSAVMQMLDELSEAIYNGGLLSAFYKFCEKKEVDLLYIRRRRIYSRYLDDKRYTDLFALTKKELVKEKKLGHITDEQYRAIMKTRRVKTKHIKAAYILSACAIDKTEEAGTFVVSYAKRSIMSRPFSFILMSIVLNSVTFAWTDTTLLDAVVGIVTSAIIIFFAALSGYKVGRNSAIWETSQRQHRIRFLYEFEEWRKNNTEMLPKC